MPNGKKLNRSTCVITVHSTCKLDEDLTVAASTSSLLLLLSPSEKDGSCVAIGTTTFVDRIELAVDPTNNWLSESATILHVPWFSGTLLKHRKIIVKITRDNIPNYLFYIYSLNCGRGSAVRLEIMWSPSDCLTRLKTNLRN